MAADQKTTPFGLMFGIEMHANALKYDNNGQFSQTSP